MKLKTLVYHTLAFFFLFQTNAGAQSQNGGNGFSLRKLFGITPTTENVAVDRHINLNNLARWSAETSRFYQNRAFQPVWFENGELNTSGQQLLQKLKASWQEGLPEPVVFLANVEEAMLNMHKRSAGKISYAEIISDADVKMTQAYLDYASQISTGILNPKALDVVWEVIPDPVDLVAHLENAIKQGNIAESFAELEPIHEEYDLLLKMFRQLMQVKASGGWPLPGSFPPLKQGETHPNVVRIKHYLGATGDLEAADSSYLEDYSYDERLSYAVKKFQQRHGLQEDGIAGENTLKQMNIPLDQRLNQIRLNLDRIRWLPDDFGKNHIVINIPDYSFTFYKDDLEIQQMKVVVGENENYTPVLEDTLYSIIFNPSWNVPNSISTKEIFPKMLNDTTFMNRNNYTVLRNSYVSKDTIDVKKHDWSGVSRDSFPFFIVQEPGPYNSLGQIQFMLQNQYAIYMHDTPADHLFDVAQRDFSHGCIRLEKPEQLAMVLLTDQLPTDTLLNYFAGKEKKVIHLEEKIPVHIVYQTAWVEDNNLHFREDVYNFDELSMAYFRESYPEIAWLLPEVNY